jgi:hypothetical protein
VKRASDARRGEGEAGRGALGLGERTTLLTHAQGEIELVAVHEGQDGGDQRRGDLPGQQRAALQRLPCPLDAAGSCLAAECVPVRGEREQHLAPEALIVLVHRARKTLPYLCMGDGA